MEIKRRDPGKVAIDMTPMIDIVFQLLTFFCMTLKIASAEGDFNIKMPIADRRPGLPHVCDLPPVHLFVKSDAQGDCTHVIINDTQYSGPDRWHRVHRHLAGIVGDGDLAKQAEVELHCDSQLHYEHAIAAITAVSGRIDPENGQVVKLIEKVKFSPPR